MSKLIWPIIAVIVALLLGALIMALGGSDPIEAYKLMLQGSIGSGFALSETVVKTASLCLAGLSYAFAYRSGLMNIGIEGQMVAGAILSSYFGIALQGLPKIIHLPICLLAGMLGGAVIGAIVAFLKNRFGANEVITTVMFNYIILFLLDFLVLGPMRATGDFPQSARIQPSAELSVIIPNTRVNSGIIIALVAVVIYGIYWFKSRKGFEMKIVGLSPNVAKAIGIDVKRNIILAFAISGALGGLVGSLEILGIQKRLVQSFSPGYGFDGIAIALLGRNNPVGIFLSAFLFSILKTGGNNMQMFSDVPSSVVMILQGIIIILMCVNIFSKKRRNM